MRIRKILADYNRWFMMAYPGNSTEARAFKSWMTDNCPDCICQYRFNAGSDPFWELRGGDHQLMLYIMLTWGD